MTLQHRLRLTLQGLKRKSYAGRIFLYGPIGSIPFQRFPKNHKPQIIDVLSACGQDQPG